MVTIICQHSGLEVEAESKRTRQHPLIAGFKDRASREDTYREAGQALDEARKRGGYSNIDEYMALVKQIIAELQDKARAQHDAKAAAYRKDEAAREQIKRERQQRNAHLKAHGYTWHRYEAGTEDSWAGRGSLGGGVGEFSHYEFEMVAPDGTVVSEKQALDEIERGMDVVRSEITAKRQAEAQRETEVAAEQAQIEQAEREAVAAFDAQVEQIQQENQRVDRIEFPVSQTVRIQWPAGREHSYYRHIDNIQRGQLNGVACWRVTVNSGYDDDGYTSYYCADPVAVGAKVYEAPPASDFDDVFSSFFG